MSLTIALQLITEKGVSDACQNTGRGGGCGAGLDLGVYFSNKMDPNNKICGTRGVRLLVVFLWVLFFLVFCDGKMRKPHCGGCERFYQALEKVGKTWTPLRPHLSNINIFILDNITSHLYGDRDTPKCSRKIS